MGEIALVMEAVPVLVGVLQLIEGRRLRVEQLPVPPQESFVDHLAPTVLAQDDTPSRTGAGPSAPGRQGV